VEWFDDKYAHLRIRIYGMHHNYKPSEKRIERAFNYDCDPVNAYDIAVALYYSRLCKNRPKTLLRVAECAWELQHFEAMEDALQRTDIATLTEEQLSLYESLCKLACFCRTGEECVWNQGLENEETKDPTNMYELLYRYCLYEKNGDVDDQKSMLEHMQKMVSSRREKVMMSFIASHFYKQTDRHDEEKKYADHVRKNSYRLKYTKLLDCESVGAALTQKHCQNNENIYVWKDATDHTRFYPFEKRCGEFAEAYSMVFIKMDKSLGRIFSIGKGILYGLAVASLLKFANITVLKIYLYICIFVSIMLQMLLFFYDKKTFFVGRDLAEEWMSKNNSFQSNHDILYFLHTFIRDVGRTAKLHDILLMQIAALNLENNQFERAQMALDAIAENSKCREAAEYEYIKESCELNLQR